MIKRRYSKTLENIKLSIIRLKKKRRYYEQNAHRGTNEYVDGIIFGIDIAINELMEYRQGIKSVFKKK